MRSSVTLAMLAAMAMCIEQASASKRPETVAIDIGHTLEAQGATSARGRGEFFFNHDLARQLFDALRERGLRPVMINVDGRIASLRARPEQAAAVGAALLLSIHHDSVSAHELRPWQWAGKALDFNDDFAGHSLFVSRENPELDHSVLCARTIGARLQRMGFVPTHKNARRRAYADAAHAVHYYDGLAVLRHAAMPAVLFEAGVIKNRDEEAALADPERQARMADGIATAIAACLQVVTRGPDGQVSRLP